MALGCTGKQAMKTTFVGKNPFTNVPVDMVDPNFLKIETGPPPTKQYTRSKYDPLFNKLKPDQAVVCERDEAEKVAQALRAFLDKTDKKGFVKTFKLSYEDGKARVFWLSKRWSAQ